MTPTIFRASSGWITVYIYTSGDVRSISVHKPKVDGCTWTEEAMGFSTHVSGIRRHLDVELLKKLREENPHH